MRWNQLAEDLPRAMALAEVLCGAACADSSFDDSERVIVGAMLMKVLGTSTLPPELVAQLATFDADKLNVVDAVARLRLDNDRDKKSLVKVVAEIVKADDSIDKAERSYIARLAKALGFSVTDAKALLK